MNNYETLLAEASALGLTVKEKDLNYNDGLIKGSRIAIRKTLLTSTERACVLAEELGHHHTTVGDILNQNDVWNRKQERQARLNGYNRLIGLMRLITAYEAGCQNCYEIAEYLEVTEGYLLECVKCYQDKYGLGTYVGEYYISFQHGLSVCKVI